uniref:Uncharacterized protein n=1 Tax=Rhizophora mucronata TaxID=61149 RepID=A0A2P2MQL2_RHIMU
MPTWARNGPRYIQLDGCYKL